MFNICKSNLTPPSFVSQQLSSNDLQKVNLSHEVLHNEYFKLAIADCF